MSENELSEFERSLQKMTPAAGVDRDRILYQAGLRAGRRPGLAASLLVVGLLLGGAGGWSLHVPSTSTTPVVATQPVVAEPLSYGVLHQRYLSGDVALDVVASEPGGSAEAPTSLGQQRDRWLREVN